MFFHSKELQYNARVSKPDPRFARLLLEQFGGGNGELKAAMQYFVQAFSCKNAYPDKYDLLMDIATEEFSHLEIVGATIQMLLSGVNGELKNAAESLEMMDPMEGKGAKENYIHQALYNSQFCVLTGGGPSVTDSNGTPWTGAYVNANGDLTVDLRSNIAAESRAKIVYEYLIKFTDDEYVKDTLRFLMTREITHFQQFEAALDTIQPNFPPGILQGDPRYSNLYFNMSPEESATGPWNQGCSSRLGEEWQNIDELKEYVEATNGLTDMEPTGTERTQDTVKNMDRELARARSKEVKSATPTENIQWSAYKDEEEKVEQEVPADCL
ncbi:MAG: manganese catalase family protein [Tannerellaceae bacterium]|nr:manganese catalase family protein [Tannerellaceae bacterium]